MGSVGVVLSSSILFTDHYQLTMAQLYLRSGLAERRARFDHTFRSYPDYGTHQAGYAIAAGLASLLDWMRTVSFSDEVLDELRGIRGSTGTQVFDEQFLGWLGAQEGFSAVEVFGIPEGRVVHAGAPMTMVEGPLALAQILETPLLNRLNFETLIATKASRVVEAAMGGGVLEFGMRRAHGLGANGATRAALIGGAAGSSNVGASLDLGYVPKGTHAHSMVQVFMAALGGELEAFRAYAETYPDDCLLLVDTIDTLESGVPNAISVFEELRRKGHKPVGIRLDSGDLAFLAVRSARMLDDAGFDDVTIVLSSQLDEVNIWQIRNQIAIEAPRYGVDPDHLLARLTYGVGSRMATSHGASSLDGVYKVVAVENDAGAWEPAIKISDSPAKIVDPGIKQVWRVYDERNTATADLIALTDEDVTHRPLMLHHPHLPDVSRTLDADHISGMEPLIEPVAELEIPDDPREVIEQARARRIADLERLDPGVRRLVNPHTYHVSHSDGVSQMKHRLTARHS
jgi:nicotinate phosphoribosyltransferase